MVSQNNKETAVILIIETHDIVKYQDTTLCIKKRGGQIEITVPSLLKKIKKILK